MSAPTTHDPLVVNTADGVTWLRRAVVDGRGLYAVTDSCKCPEYLMASLAELAEHGIAGSADALPMPVGPQPLPFPPAPQTFEEKLRQDVARLQGLLAEAVRDAHRARSERDLIRERVSEPFGCARCGVEKRSHGRRYIGGAGMHAWERPSDEQVKARMLARRVARSPLPAAPELEQLHNDLTGANLSLWEEEQATERLRWALVSAKRGRSRLRARVAELEARDAEAPIAAGLTELAAGEAQRSADRLTALMAPPQALREDEPATKCRCDEPGADPYSCEADDCTGEFSELNPFGGGPVQGHDAKVSRTCTCGWRTTVWHVADGSAEEQLHGHIVRVHGGTAPEVSR